MITIMNARLTSPRDIELEELFATKTEYFSNSGKYYGNTIDTLCDDHIESLSIANLGTTFNTLMIANDGYGNLYELVIEDMQEEDTELENNTILTTFNYVISLNFRRKTISTVSFNTKYFDTTTTNRADNILSAFVAGTIANYLKIGA